MKRLIVATDFCKSETVTLQGFEVACFGKGLEILGCLELISTLKGLASSAKEIATSLASGVDSWRTLVWLIY